MTKVSAIENRACERVVDALQAEFGAIVAERILEAEAADFLWDARVKERYLGQHIEADPGFGEQAQDLSRMLVVSFLGGRWHVGLCLVNGDGEPVELLWKLSFERRDEAEAEYDRRF